MHQLTGSRPEDLLLAALTSRGETPLVGWYDEAAVPPARMELSARSLATWAAKTMGLLTDELGLPPGLTVSVALPAHWVTVAVVAGVWAAGGEVLTAPATGPVDVAVVTVAGLAAGRPDADEVLVVDPASAWQLGNLPGLGADPAVRDLVLALRPHADRFPGGGFPGAPTDPALDGTGRADLVARAVARAGELGWTGDLATPPRVAWTRGLADAAALTDAVVAPWALGGSLVLVNGADDARLASIAATEHVTHVS